MAQFPAIKVPIVDVGDNTAIIIKNIIGINNDTMAIQTHMIKQSRRIVARHIIPSVPHVNPIVAIANNPAQDVHMHPTIKIPAHKVNMTNIASHIITAEHSEHPMQTEH